MTPLEILGTLALGALIPLVILGLILAWKVRGFRIRLDGLRFTDAQEDATERQLLELREIERRAAE